MKQLKKLSLKRVREDSLVSQDIARSLCALSFEISRQIGVLIDRRGYVQHVIAGDSSSILIPELEQNRSGRLRGLRLVHTHLRGEPLSEEDLYDLTLLRLDYITAVTMDKQGLPQYFYSASILPGTQPGYQIEKPCRPGQLPENFSQCIANLENLFAKAKEKKRDRSQFQDSSKTTALLAGVYTPAMRRKRTPLESIQELKELCRTANIDITGVITQKRPRLDSLSLVGSGKAKQIVLEAVQKNAEMIIFDLELTAAQAKRLSQICDLKIVDRTQLILDIFARNAASNDGKLQVELAQLRYLKGRLSEKDDNMSRLTGGIGGRGPGETKLEIGRRRVGERIRTLEQKIDKLKKRRALNRSRRKENLPIVSIVGYANAGKSTLLNTLTRSEVLAEDRLFATLDPTARRLRFPENKRQKEIILSDTVGFIHDLPPDLKNAFAAAIEELGDAELLLHCIDANDSCREQKIRAVENILHEMNLGRIPVIRVFTKCDLIPKEESTFIEESSSGICISALHKTGLEPLLDSISSSLIKPL